MRLVVLISPTGMPIVASDFSIRLYAPEIAVLVRVAKSDFGFRVITPSETEAHIKVSDSIQ